MDVKFRAPAPKPGDLVSVGRTVINVYNTHAPPGDNLVKLVTVLKEETTALVVSITKGQDKETARGQSWALLVVSDCVGWVPSWRLEMVL